MKMLSPFDKKKTAKPKQNKSSTKVRKRKKSLLDYFRCLSCKCSKGDVDNSGVIGSKGSTNSHQTPSRPLEAADDTVQRYVQTIKTARKLSVDANGATSATPRLHCLQRQISASLPDMRANPCSVQAKPILKHPTHTMSERGRTHKKRARFSEEVDVFLCGANVVVKDTLKHAADDYVKNGKSMASRVIINATRAQKVFKLDSVEIERRRASGRRTLRLVILVGGMGVKERVTVCSARGGTRLVLTTSRIEPLGDGTFFRRQLADKFRLPHPIDACSLRARVNPQGHLVVEAAMFDFDDERSG